MPKLFFSLPVLILSIWAFFIPQPSPSNITLCGDEKHETLLLGAPTSAFVSTSFENDSTKAYSMPALSYTKNGKIMLTWTEKDASGNTALCIAYSEDQGKSFGPKHVVFSGNGVGNSRMMRARILEKKDGSLVAIFANRAETTSGKNSRAANLVFCVSADAGKTWTKPAMVDSDPTQGVMRGFFDATLLANGEIAVAYLKDVANSTKREERDLRLVLSKNGVFQPETVIDPVVCDCCPINLLVDNKGALHVYYRDNNDDIRDIAQMVSTDHGQSFSKPKIVLNDQWKINGCPHSGAISVVQDGKALISWFSGAENASGIRLATQEGKKLTQLEDPTAKNPSLTSNGKTAVLLWEQNHNDDNLSQLAYKKIEGSSVSDLIWVPNTALSTNSSAIFVGNQLLVARESIQANKKNKISIATLAL
jgi:BNR repeat-like domain